MTTLKSTSILASIIVQNPSQATEDQYDYFLDCWSGDDEYQYLYDYYENKYPEYNQELKHYGK